MSCDRARRVRGIAPHDTSVDEHLHVFERDGRGDVQRPRHVGAGRGRQGRPGPVALGREPQQWSRRDVAAARPQAVQVAIERQRPFDLHEHACRADRHRPVEVRHDIGARRGCDGDPDVQQPVPCVRRPELVAPQARDLQRVHVAVQRVGHERERQTGGRLARGERSRARDRVHVGVDSALRPDVRERGATRAVVPVEDGVARPPEPRPMRRREADPCRVAQEVRPDFLAEGDERRGASPPVGPGEVEDPRVQVAISGVATSRSSPRIISTRSPGSRVYGPP